MKKYIVEMEKPNDEDGNGYFFNRAQFPSPMDFFVYGIENAKKMSLNEATKVYKRSVTDGETLFRIIEIFND